MSQPIKVGDNVILKIEALANSPDGIGKIDNFVVFIPYVVPEDEVKVLITEVRKNFARGKLLSVLNPSKFRIKPKCPSFGECGGCHWQDIDYKKQLEYKNLLLENTIRRLKPAATINMKDVTINPIIPANKSFYYRNKTQFPVDIQKRKIGLYALRSHYVINLEDCHLILKSINDVYKEIKKFLEKVNFNIPTLRHLVIRGSETRDNLFVIFVLKNEDLESVRSVIEYVRQKFPYISILCNINEEETNVILGDRTVKVYGEGILKEVLDGIEYNFSPLSFFQTNTEQTLTLYRLIKSYIKGDKNSLALDLYCGVGTISLFVADLFKEVIGLDEVREAISDAKNNAKINNITNCKFLCGKAENILVKLMKEKLNIDTVILDPPRNGVSYEILLNLKKLNISNIIYVSCDIATLARDIEVLIKEGYKINEIQPIDMFPNTYHIETVVKMNF
ncbi:MAG: 23S rRNA (uracil(1939)-C(5))-methyltransferase RlmD [Candidatus Firestonebacteria bacterium]